MTPEQHKKASEQVDVLKQKVVPQTASTKLTKEEQIIYNSIPDRFKNLGLGLINERTVWNPDVDIRVGLFKKGLVRIWQTRPDIVRAFDIGFGARNA